MADEDKPSESGNPSVLAFRRNWFQTALVKFLIDYTPKCREMVRLLSQALDRKLPLMTRVKMRLHFLICVWCERYAKHLHYLRKFGRALPKHTNEVGTPGLPESAKTRIKRTLRDQGM
jgi:hypothetical protein